MDVGELESVAHFQATLVQAMDRGYTLLGGREIHSIPFFAIVRHIMQLVASGGSSLSLQSYLFDKSLELRWESRIHAIEYLRAMDRFRLIGAVGTLLGDWPDRFIAAGKSLGLTKTDLMRQMEQVPFALARAIDEHFDYRSYVPSIGEIQAAVRHLRRTGEPVTSRTVSRLLGASDVMRKRKLHHLIRSSDQS